MRYKDRELGDVVAKKNGMGRELIVVKLLSNNRVKVKSDTGETWEEYTSDLVFIRRGPPPSEQDVS